MFYNFNASQNLEVAKKIIIENGPHYSHILIYINYQRIFLKIKIINKILNIFENFLNVIIDIFLYRKK